MKSMVIAGDEASDIRVQFSGVSERTLFRAIGSYCGSRSRGPLGGGNVILQDDNGDRHLFHFESFSNTYDVLTLGSYLKRFRVAVAV